MNRRRVLAAAGTALSASLAGCAGLGGSTPTIDHPDASVKWATPLDDRPNAIVADADRLYASTYWDVHGIDRAGGGIDWTHRVDEPSDALCYDGGATIGGNTVYGRSCRELFAVDATTGEERWRDSNVSGGYEPPVVGSDGDVLYLPGEELAAYGIADRSVRWRTDVEAEGFEPIVTDYGVRAPVVTDYGIYATSTYADVFLFGEEGDLRWRHATFPPGSGDLTTPVLADGTLVVGKSAPQFDPGLLFGFDPADGTVRWQTTVRDLWSGQTPALDDERVYLAGSDDHCYAHALDTGGEVWRATLTPGCADCWRTSDPVVVDDTVCAAGREALVAFDAETGEEKWRLPLDGGFAAGPVVVEGTVYVAGERAYAVAV